MTIVPFVISVRIAPSSIAVCRVLSAAGTSRSAGMMSRAVDLERLLLVAVHQVDVELVDAGIGQLAQLLDMVLDGADDAEAVDDLIAHERCVGRADFGVVQVVVALASWT